MAHDVFLPIVREWAARTATGDRAELEDLPEDLPFWNEVAATAETCLGTECTRYEECFVTRMRQQAAASDVVIVNHHLLCADAAVRQSAFGEVIPACSHLVLDEAHQLEDVVTQYFGLSVSTYRLEDLARDAERLAASKTLTDRKARDEIARAADRSAIARARSSRRSRSGTVPATGRRARSGSAPPTARSPARATRVRRSPARWTSSRRRSRCSGTPAGAPDADDDGLREAAAGLARRAGEIRTDVRFLLRATDPEFVYFVEFRGKGVFLRAAPIDVANIVRDALVDRMQTTVFTSATLTVDGSFEYVRERLGIGSADELRLPSEFDFSRQAVLYLPPRMPDPRSSDFTGAAGREVVEILKRTEGRAFVLFTSYATMRTVQAIAEMALDYPIFAQGTAPRTQLLRQFRETRHAVLFATASFWQGVDVVGEALSCVIVDKLPFASPADPITSARIDAIRARGGEPFDEYQVPLAILALLQGLGRLIRHRRDRGVLAILDPRLRTKGYGRRFLASLPPAPIVHELGAVQRFLAIV